MKSKKCVIHILVFREFETCIFGSQRGLVAFLRMAQPVAIKHTQ